MLFGEIVEPSSRALITEDDELSLSENAQQIEDVRDNLKWQGDSSIPDTLSSLIVAETPVILEILQNFVLEKQPPSCELENGALKVFEITPDTYIVTFKSSDDICYGEAVEILSPWLTSAKNVYTITSAPSALYVNTELTSRPAHCIRCLVSDSKNFGYQKLESPNLVSGVSAGVLSYRVHVGKPCSLFVAYVESVPLDSVVCKPVVDLMERIGVSFVKPVELGIQVPSSNLYM